MIEITIISVTLIALLALSQPIIAYLKYKQEVKDYKEKLYKDRLNTFRRYMSRVINDKYKDESGNEFDYDIDTTIELIGNPYDIRINKHGFIDEDITVTELTYTYNELFKEISEYHHKAIFTFHNNKLQNCEIR
jgi:hypothetical protein